MVTEKQFKAMLAQHNAWGPIKVPTSIAEFIATKEDEFPEVVRDMKLLIEDRRVTDLSAHYWMTLKS